jgi:hypothetical protein
MADAAIPARLGRCARLPSERAKALLTLAPIEDGGEAEDAEEGAGGLLVAGGAGAPLLQLYY